MISFKIYVNEQLQLLKEGGNAIDGVVRINQENVAATMEVVYKKLISSLGLRQDDTALLGSTGKKNPHSSSGDIDVAVSITSLMAKHKNLKTMGDIIDFVAAKSQSIVAKVKILRGIGIVTMGFPIENADGKQPDEIVQLDLMLSDNTKFASWMYFSPHEKDSPWKGLYRNSMLSAISHHADRQGDDEEWDRYLLHFNNGLTRVKESRKGKRGLNKNSKIVERKIPIKDADQIVAILLGSSFKAKQILTYEDVFKAFMSSKFAWAKDRKQIAKRAIDDILGKGYPVPDELAKVGGIK